MSVSAHIQVSKYSLREGGLFFLRTPPFMIPGTGPRWPHARPTVCIIPIFFYFFILDVVVYRHEGQRFSLFLYIAALEALCHKGPAICQGIQGLSTTLPMLLFYYFINK
jgi:hypothetical protein